MRFFQSDIQIIRLRESKYKRKEFGKKYGPTIMKRVFKNTTHIQVYFCFSQHRMKAITVLTDNAGIYTKTQTTQNLEVK